MTACANEAIGLELGRTGFVHVRGPLDRRRYFELARGLGEVVHEEMIALRPGAHAYVARPGAVPLHTDHPEVDVIGWLCEEQDDADGASLVLDTRPVITSLGEEERAVLRRVELACPPLAGGPPTERWPVLRPRDGGDAVFCSPWLRSAHAIAAHETALERFRVDLSTRARRDVLEVRLAVGEALFIDNHRMLHGRRRLLEASRRRLRRVWLQGEPAGAGMSPGGTSL